MRRVWLPGLFAILLAALLCAQSAAVVFKTSESELELDLPSGWTAVKKDDPANILEAVSGGSSISIIRRDDELSERYLKMRLEEALESVRAKGARPDGNIESLSIHGAASFYYTGYSAGADSYTIGIFTYGEKSFNFEGKNLSGSILPEVVWSLRMPGETVKTRERPVVVKAEPRPVRKQAKPVVKHQEPAAEPAPEPETTAETVLPPVEQHRALAPNIEPTTQDGKPLLPPITPQPGAERTSEQKPAPPKPLAMKPFLQRTPLMPTVVIILLAAWVVGRFAAAAVAGRKSYPKLGAPPKDLPPDWFFPFFLTRFNASSELQYGIKSRHGQVLKARFDKNGHGPLALGIYGLIALHASWSLLYWTPVYDRIISAIAHAPLGGLWLSVPELPFLLLVFAGVAKILGSSGKLRLYDREETLVLQAAPFDGEILFKDGKGKEIGRLKRLKSKLSGRAWQYVDADGQDVFAIVDDHPAMFWLRRIFGSAGGALRGRYSFFAKDQRAGFILNDPMSVRGFQYHCDFAFARLARPVHIVGALLYAQSTEVDYPYPWL